MNEAEDRIEPHWFVQADEILLFKRSAGVSAGRHLDEP
jgi:hypothetical protein